VGADIEQLERVATPGFFYTLVSVIGPGSGGTATIHHCSCLEARCTKAPRMEPGKDRGAASARGVWLKVVRA
jgi:hypothetical protein